MFNYSNSLRGIDTPLQITALRIIFLFQLLKGYWHSIQRVMKSISRSYSNSLRGIDTFVVVACGFVT